MTLFSRKLIIVGAMFLILALAGAYTVVSWLDDCGVIGWARGLRDEYLTGTAITITIVLIILIGAPAGCMMLRRCPVCEQVLLRPGQYCSTCGSRM